MTDQGGFAAGWYPNPEGGPGLRWYDGERWTDDYHHEAGGYEPQTVASQPPDWYTQAPEPGAPGVYGAAPVAGAAPNYIGANRGYQPPPAKSPWGYFASVITEQYATFSGRARRAEYWWFYVIDIAIMLALLIGGVLVVPELGVGLFLVWNLATFLPALAVAVRRLHDTNKSGWTILISFLPFGSIVLFIFMVVDGDSGPNRYGYPPK